MQEIAGHDRWNDRGATSKMGEINRTVSHPWNYTNIQDRRLQTSLAHLRIGHTHFTHSYLMSGDYQPYCDDLSSSSDCTALAGRVPECERTPATLPF